LFEPFALTRRQVEGTSEWMKELWLTQAVYAEQAVFMAPSLGIL
jgi:hypothetical protein